MDRRGPEQRPNADAFLERAAAVMTLPSSAGIWEDLASQLGRALQVDLAFVAEVIPSEETVVRTLGAWRRGKIVPNFQQRFEAILREDILHHDVCFYASDAQKHLPDGWLKRIKAQAFGRVNLIDSFGRTRGILVIAHSEPLRLPKQAAAFLRIFAFRAAAELENGLEDKRFYQELLAAAESRLK